MGQLDADRHVLRVGEVDDPAQRRHLMVRPQAEIAYPDTAMRRDRGALRQDQPGPAQDELAEMDQVPVGRATVLGRVLAHRRDHNPVLQRQPPKRRGA